MISSEQQLEIEISKFIWKFISIWYKLLIKLGISNSNSSILRKSSCGYYTDLPGFTCAISGTNPNVIFTLTASGTGTVNVAKSAFKLYFWVSGAADDPDKTARKFYAEIKAKSHYTTANANAKI